MTNTRNEKDGLFLRFNVARIVLAEEEEEEEEARIVVSLLDVTERKRAEENLRESEERYRLLMETLPDGVFVHSQGRIVFANPASARLIGAASPAELIGRRVIKFVHPDYRELALKRIRQSLSEGVLAPITEEKIIRLDGTEIDVEVTAIPFSYASQPAMLTVTTDITKRKRAEAALRESRARLARLARRLVDAQEQERRRIARELHDEVGQNLTALTISLESVSQLAMDGVIRGKITEIQELTKHLIAEVNALSVELRPRVLDDLGLIPGLLSLFSRFSTQTGIEIDFKHTGIERKRLAPEIEISAYRIIQEALTNVVRHAGVKTASVRLQVEADTLWIQVQDEGKGFDLQQAMNAEDSMGLLSMMERAEQVGGHLAVETAPGEGTLITCRLPLAGNHVERREYGRGENHPGR